MQNPIIAATIVLSLAALALYADPTGEAGLVDKYQPAPAPAVTGTLLKKGDRLAICGDSITEQRMYSRIIEDYLTLCTPELKVSVRQFGWGGERADGFLKRMTNDCLRFEPTIATTCYGMNDHEYRPYVDSIGSNYNQNMTAVVDSFKAHGVRVVVGSPGCVGNRNWWQAGATSEALNQNLCKLRNIDIALAAKEKVGFADIFWPMLTASFQANSQYGPNYNLSGGDAVHPGWAGHVVMAYAFLKGLGLKGDIAQFTLDEATHKLTVSAGHKLVSSQGNAFVITSSKFPFCADAPMGLAANWYPTAGFYSLTNNDNLRSGMAWVPFQQDFNRFMLTVSHPAAAKYKVTWGDYNKEFSGAQLAQGVNLADEFGLNPFSTRFAMVDAAISAKQEFETRQIKVLFRPAGLGSPMDQVVAQTEKELAYTERQHAALDKVIQAAIAPVTYTLKVEAE
ncbi:MAG TPA: SGNH/GDSL hydrolase family protein [Verrucomicrobiae bacterium]